MPSLESFEPLSQDEVKAIISDLGTKSCESDVIPTKLLKKCLSGLLPCITKIVNISLSSGAFPSNYKEAIVRPLLKKQGLEQQCSNYRPVSNLTFMSKVMEKAMLHHFDKHCDDHDLLPNNQSAYRPKVSCETALLRLTNDILVGMEQKEVTPLLAIDLSAAFDTVNHNNTLGCISKTIWYQKYSSKLGIILFTTTNLQNHCSESIFFSEKFGILCFTWQLFRPKIFPSIY